MTDRDVSAPDIGLIIRPWGCPVEQILDAARAADDRGIHIWLAGQVLPTSTTSDKPAFEPITLGGAIAAVTSVSRIGFMVLAPYLPPIYLAKALATLDHLCDGRLDVGLGAGQSEQEFAAVGLPFDGVCKRLEQVEATVDALDSFTVRGAHETGPAASPPSRQAPRPPVWIAGQGARVLEVVARRADWANFARGISPADFADNRRLVSEQAREAGRAEGAVRFSLTGAILGEETGSHVVAERARARGVDPPSYLDTLRSANTFVGSTEEIAGQLQPYVQAGCEAVALWPLTHDLVAAVDTLAAVRTACASIGGAAH